RFCPDVNASCRFVKNKNSWGWNQPFRQQHLLLVAARDGVRQLLYSSCHDSRQAGEFLGNLRFSHPVDKAKSVSKLTQDRERLVRANRKWKYEPLLVTVFRQERDSEPHRMTGRTRLDNVTVDSDLAPIGSRDAEEHLADFRAARTH